MQERDSSQIVSPTPVAPVERRRAVAFTLDEKKRIFKAMVVGALEAGFLRYSWRQELLRYAKTLQIPEFEATLLIAEAQYYSGDIEPMPPGDAAGLGPELPAPGWSIPTRLCFALTAAIFIDLLLIYWLF